VDPDATGDPLYGYYSDEQKIYGPSVILSEKFVSGQWVPIPTKQLTKKDHTNAQLFISKLNDLGVEV